VPTEDPAGEIDVLLVVPPESLLLDVAGPAEALRLANARLVVDGRPRRFRLRFVGPAAQASTSVGLTVSGLEALPGELVRPTWLVLVGQPGLALRTPGAGTDDTVDWLRDVGGPALEASPASRLVTVCAGTLLAARAGLIGARRCTTHHEHLATLRELAPQAHVVDNRVFVIDGSLASSAGITAGIDLTLHLVAQTCGEDVAAAVAQAMVVYLRRTQADPELSPLLAHRHHLHAALHRVQDAVCARPEATWTLDSLAAAGHVTGRHLLRLFALHAEVSPTTYVETIRLERARQALVHGATVSRAAEQGGFSSDLQLRRAWSRHLPGTPRVARRPV